jgi:hypothetical protein
MVKSHHRGLKMRAVAFFLFCIFSGQAAAQTTECQSIPKASDRLACCDRAAPPKAAGKPTASKISAVPAKPVASNAPSDQGQVIGFEAKDHLPGMLRVLERLEKLIRDLDGQLP